MNLKQYLLVEKYRPKIVKDVIGSATIQKYIDKPDSLPHFIFAGKVPGTGKTSLAEAIITQLGCEAMRINGSKDRGVAIVRDSVLQFARTSNSGSVKKCVFFDEAHGLLKQTQEALFNIMEKFSGNVFFIFTCNHIEKIEAAIKSRCVVEYLNTPDRAQIKSRLLHIIKTEGISGESEQVNSLIDRHYPSIRDMIKVLHQAKVLQQSIGELLSSDSSLFLQLWHLIAHNKFKDIQKLVLSGRVSPEEFNDWMFRRLIADDKGDPKMKRKIVQILADCERAFSQGANSDIILLDGICKMIEVL